MDVLEEVLSPWIWRDRHLKGLAGGSPGNLVLLTCVFLETSRSPWPPHGYGPYVWTLALVHLCSILYISMQKRVACSSIPRFACWRDSGCRWNPLHLSLLSRTPRAVSLTSPAAAALGASVSATACLFLTAELCSSCVFWLPHGRFMSHRTLEQVPQNQEWGGTLEDFRAGMAPFDWLQSSCQ